LYMSQGVLFLLLGCENLPIKVKVELVLWSISNSELLKNKTFSGCPFNC
jgi:hypothetical protein